MKIVRLVAILSAGYFLSQFLRASIAVISPDLVAELSLSPAALGGLAGAFFIAFSVMQIPLGAALDSFGARRTMGVLAGFAALGALLFALGHSRTVLLLARVAMGVGCASLFIGSLIVYARWFPRHRFASISSIEMAIGYLGSLMATAPLAYAAAHWGWRPVFVAVGGLALIIWLGLVLLVRDAPEGHAFHRRRRQGMAEIVGGFRAVLANPQLRYVLAMQLVGYGSMISLLGLWAGPYLADVHGLDLVARGRMLLLMAAFSVVGLLVFGPLDRVFNTRKWLVVTGVVLNACLLAALALLRAPSLALSMTLLCLITLGNGYSVALITHGRSIFSDTLVGRGMTVLNTANMGGAAVLQVVTGLIAGWPATGAGTVGPLGYRLVFGFLATVLVGALLFYLRARDIRPNER